MAGEGRAIISGWGFNRRQLTDLHRLSERTTKIPFNTPYMWVDWYWAGISITSNAKSLSDTLGGSSSGGITDIAY